MSLLLRLDKSLVRRIVGQGLLRNTIIFLFLLVSLSSLSACERPTVSEGTVQPPLITEPPSAEAFASLNSLQHAHVPPRDLVALTERLRGVSNVPRLVEPASYTTGDVTSFWYKNHATNENEQINARLVYHSELLNLWLQEGQTVDENTLNSAAKHLEEVIMPTNRAFFGEEWQPGVDGDPRLNILHLKEIGGNVVGYFSAADGFVTAVNSFSNQRKLFYVSLKQAPVGSDDYYEVIAHEMQHMIHWHVDSNEATWLDEGLAVLAATLNGYELVEFDEAYTSLPDVQLNNFEYESDAALAHYGASFLFTAYFLDRFGEQALRRLVQHPDNGIQGFTETLAALEQPLTFDSLFADWLVATYLEGHGLGEGIYQYHNRNIPLLEPSNRPRRFPATGLTTVSQYGADFIQLENERPLTVLFTGTQQTALLPTMPYSGRSFWTSVPADDSDMTLTRRFDLSELDTATLSFWSWYDIEENWDYAYLAVSTDEGVTWKMLETERMTRDNPQGNSYGPALTGFSGGGRDPAWIRQEADLSPFTGGPVLLRFEYVTDDAVHRPGLALDDITIPELAYSHDAEAGAGGWEGVGFVRHSNQLPQSFLIQMISVTADGTRVERLPVDENQQGKWLIPLDNQAKRAILIISGTTPVTTLPASYSYRIQE